MQSNVAGLYVSTMDFVFETYALMVQPMKELFQKRLPTDKFVISVERKGNRIDNVHENELINDEERKAFKNAYTFTIRSAVCDIIRCVLPAATTTNVGLSGNGRFYTNLVSKMMSMELQEANDAALLAKTELDKVIPTFVKRAAKNTYLVETNDNMRRLADELLGLVPIEKEKELVMFEDKPEDFLNNLVAEMLFPYSRHSTSQLRNVVKSFPKSVMNEVINTYIGNRRNKKDRPERSLEFGYSIRFDIVGGFAEYRDLQRHRMLTQQRQELGVDLGYSIPEEINEIGFLSQVKDCFGKAEHLHSELKRSGFRDEAQYAALFNHFIRWTMGMNPRELEHLTELRSQKAGHPRYRRVAQNMAKMYLEKHPEMEPLLHYVDYSDDGNKIARAEAEARTAYKSLVSGVENDSEE